MKLYDSTIPVFVGCNACKNYGNSIVPASMMLKMNNHNLLECIFSGGPSFRYFQSIEEAKCAISTVLSADPRSVYRRNRCLDRLFYFSLDTMHMTCWFGDGFAEVVRIQPVSQA